MLAAATPAPKATLLTALPLMWGEGSIAEVLASRSRRSPLLEGLAIRPIDTLATTSLGRDVLIVAQPRLLAPQELVVLDTWVRAGGRLLLFSDPRLTWPGAFPLGDVRNPPPVGLLDPLLAHWGLTLMNDRDGIVTLTLDGFAVAARDTGRWQVPRNCRSPVPAMADCRIGRGRAILIADADLLDARLPGSESASNAAWLRATVARLAQGERPSDSPRGMLPAAIIALSGVMAGLLTLLIWWLLSRREMRT